MRGVIMTSRRKATLREIRYSLGVLLMDDKADPWKTGKNTHHTVSFQPECPFYSERKGACWWTLGTCGREETHPAVRHKALRQGFSLPWQRLSAHTAPWGWPVCVSTHYHPPPKWMPLPEVL